MPAPGQVWTSTDKKDCAVLYLNLKEVANLFGISEKTVYRLLNKGELPGIKVGGQWRFNRQEVETWLKKEKPEAYIADHLYDSDIEYTKLSLSDFLTRGGIFFKVAGNSANDVLENAVSLIYLDPQVDRQKLLKAVITREKLCSTAIGQGIALPHPRHPYQSNFKRSSISLCFLENKIDFGARDNKPVNKLFFVFGKTEKEHLYLLKILVTMLRQPEFVNILESETNRQDILNIVQHLEPE